MPNRRNDKKLARGERLQIMLTPDELTAVDDFRFHNRMPSRAAAVRELFRIGLASTGLVESGEGRKSADIGALEGDKTHLKTGGLPMVGKDGSST